MSPELAGGFFTHWTTWEAPTALSQFQEERGKELSRLCRAAPQGEGSQSLSLSPSILTWRVIKAKVRMGLEVLGQGCS